MYRSTFFPQKLCQHNLSRTTCIYEVVGKKKGVGRDRGGGEGKAGRERGRKVEKEGCREERNEEGSKA